MNPKTAHKDRTKKERKDEREHRKHKREHSSILCCFIPGTRVSGRREGTQARERTRPLRKAVFFDGGVF